MDARRRDLAAMIAPLQRALVAAEQPVHTQAALAEFIGADKSRIIGVLDEPEADGLLERSLAVLVDELPKLGQD